jgi:hypothetical protein
MWGRKRKVQVGNNNRGKKYSRRQERVEVNKYVAAVPPKRKNNSRKRMEHEKLPPRLKILNI